MTAAHCNDWCGPGSHHMPPCPAAPSEPPADLSDWERERQDAARFLPPAEAQQDDRHPKVCPKCKQWCVYDGWDHVHTNGLGIGSCAARPSADTETLRPVLLAHHPIMRSEDGPLSGCRCGQVGLGQDVIAHVADKIRAALDGTE